MTMFSFWEIIGFLQHPGGKNEKKETKARPMQARLWGLEIFSKDFLFWRDKPSNAGVPQDIHCLACQGAARGLNSDLLLEDWVAQEMHFGRRKRTRSRK